jgi:hypothetical protein
MSQAPSVQVEFVSARFRELRPKYTHTGSHVHVFSLTTPNGSRIAGCDSTAAALIRASPHVFLNQFAPSEDQTASADSIPWNASGACPNTSLHDSARSNVTAENNNNLHTIDHRLTICRSPYIKEKLCSADLRNVSFFYSRL